MLYRIIMGGMMFNIISPDQRGPAGSGNTRIHALHQRDLQPARNIVGNHSHSAATGFPAPGDHKAIATVFGTVVACASIYRFPLRRQLRNIRTTGDWQWLSLWPVKAIAKLWPMCFWNSFSCGGFMTAVMTATNWGPRYLRLIRRPCEHLSILFLRDGRWRQAVGS